MLVQAPALPVRFGPTAVNLTRDDLDQMVQLTKDRGRLWAVLARSPSGLATETIPWVVHVYLEPSPGAGRIRRGAFLTVTAKLPWPETNAAARTWVLSSSGGEWAAEGTSGRDRNRPFFVRGAISDDVLSSVVSFVRTNPTSPDKTAVEGAWPILAVSIRDETTVEVTLVKPDSRELSGQAVVLTRTGTRWTVKSVSVWIV